MSDQLQRGILVVGHGSRREEANEDVREAARRIGERGAFPLTEAAFLELATPDIRTGFARLVANGALSITVHPYFLSPGRHTRGDLPRKVREAAAHYPEVGYRITEPLSAHRLVIEASVERIREAEDGLVAADEEKSRRYRAQSGRVYLVGAGPGDPALLTVKARDLLQSCDVVVYDNLVDPEVLRHVPEHAEQIYAGKIGGGRQMPQEEINRILVHHARRGSRVVRLKGGDPFLFGRGGEEAEALRAAGILFEVVPGISSALAVPAYAGIPVTHRGVSSSVAVLTGARGGDGACAPENLEGAAAADTIVVLMGMAHLRSIAEDLVTAGRSPDTPAAVVRWGTYQGQQTVTGTLRTIAEKAERAGLRSPAVIVVGEVVALRERLRWFDTTTAGEAGHEIELRQLVGR